jgi:2-polyprenyl-3-methyl-5-hydroxy-6-metoxy-1,4-benzoquinol methylase
MDAQTWRTEQRRLREALRAQRRTPDGRDAIQAVELQPPDLTRTPIVSSGGVRGRVIVEAKKLLRRLLAPYLLEPQTRFNQQVSTALSEQRDQLESIAHLIGVSTELSNAAMKHAQEFDYLGFEERFRGSKDATEARQAEYLDYFSGGEVLDIGCGRGEFLAMLRERGTTARGVDLDADMVAHCRARGLAVECADAVEFLNRQPDGRFEGVFMSQVIEHLTPDHLVALLEAIGRKTSTEAVLIIETINPESLPVLMRWFWLDPTHVRLVHPETLQYLLEKAGFEVKTVQFRRPVPDDEQIPTLELASVPADELTPYNQAITRVNARLYGPLDYFVVGQTNA